MDWPSISEVQELGVIPSKADRLAEIREKDN
jgi:hypothetical protein